MSYLDLLPPDMVREIIKLINKDDYLNFVKVPCVVLDNPYNFCKHYEDVWTTSDGIRYHNSYKISPDGLFNGGNFETVRLSDGSTIINRNYRYWKYQDDKLIHLRRVGDYGCVKIHHSGIIIKEHILGIYEHDYISNEDNYLEHITIINYDELPLNIKSSLYKERITSCENNIENIIEKWDTDTIKSYEQYKNKKKYGIHEKRDMSGNVIERINHGT